MPSTERIWNEIGADLRQFVGRRVRDEHAVEDLLQEIFVRVHQDVDSLREDEKLEPWVFRVARNVVADHYRRRTLAGLETVDVAAQEENDGGARNINTLVNGWLAHMLLELPEGYREAVELAEQQGLSQREIAQRLGLSLSGAKSRVQRGRALLREKLLECCHLDFDRRGNVVDFERLAKCHTCRDR